MKHKTSNGVVSRIKIYASGLCLLAMMGFGQSAYANLAQNAQIKSLVTVTFSEGADVTQTNTVTVNLVRAGLTVSAGTPTNTSIGATGESTITYTLTSNANGTDNYQVSISATCDNGGGFEGCENDGFDADGVNDGEEINAVPATSGDITLGATTIISISSNVVTVPWDGGSTDSILNDLAVGDTVKVGSVSACNITAVSDAGTAASPTTVGTTTSTITVDTCSLTNGTGEAGLVVGETTTVDVTLDPDDQGTLSLTANTIVRVQYETLDGAGANGVNATADVTVTVTTVTVSKFVRNLSASAETTVCGDDRTEAELDVIVGAATIDPQALGGVTTGQDYRFCTTNIAANPGETLQYLIEVAVTSSAASTSKVLENIPQFTSYVAGTLQISDESFDTGALDTQTDADDTGDRGEVDVPAGTVTQAAFYIGSGADDVASGFNDGTGGTVATDDTVLIFYEVLVE